MTTAYTSLLGLALPVTGELSGTWGDTVNNGITSLVDSAVAGTTNVSTDADVTLTTTTGAANTAREAILLFSGARTLLRTVTAPAQSKIYTVINATTGGFAVKLVGAGPTTGLTIPNGASAVVAWNGSDFVEIGAGSIGNLIVNGTLTVTGATTLQSTLAVTGNITNTAGTANGVAYLNGSKVVTSGSALTFDGTVLRVNGSTTSGLRLASSSGAANGFNLYNDSSTDSAYVMNFYNGPLVFGQNNAEGMRLTSTGLGIGTSSPSQKLDVVGSVQIQSTGTLYLNNSDNTNQYYWQNIGSTGGNNATLILSRTNAGETLRIDSSGNLLVGTTSGSDKITAYASSGNCYVTSSRASKSSGQAALKLGGGTGGTDWIFYQDINDDNLKFFGNSATRMTLDTNGILGIAVTPSTSWSSGRPAMQIGTAMALDCNNPSQAVMSANRVVTATQDVYINSNYATSYMQLNGVHSWYTAASGTAGNAITFTQAMTLDASGALAIGTTSANAKLHVSNGGAAGLEFNPISGYLGGGYIQGYNRSTSAFMPVEVIAESFGVVLGSTRALTVDTSGNLLVGTTSNPGILNKSVVVDSGASSLAGFVMQNNATGRTSSDGGALLMNGTEMRLTNYENNAMLFSTNNAERARIDSSGNLLVGTTSAGGRLTVVAGSAIQSPIATSSVTGDTTYQAILVTKFDNDSTTSQNFIQFQINNGAANCGKITANGANTAAFGSTSDQRVKENIVELPSQLANIMALRPVEFDYIESYGGGHQIGFIAQEMQQVYPDVIAEDESEEKILSITGWSKTEARLVKAIQEQQAIIESLKARLDAANL